MCCCKSISGMKTPPPHFEIKCLSLINTLQHSLGFLAVGFAEDLYMEREECPIVAYADAIEFLNSLVHSMFIRPTSFQALPFPVC